MIFVPGKNQYDFEEGQVILIDKPLKWTSFDVVNKVRYLIRNQFGLKKIKVGHAGTLDPLATGLLVICTGKFTKQIETLQASNKEYVGTFMLGATTPSFDRETEVDRTYSTDGITKEKVEEVLRTFEGEQDQVPPIFSAKQIGGQRAYVAARKGHDVELSPSRINIERIWLMEYNMPLVTVGIKCSKGTYIRALARDFGERLGSGAYLHDLRRTASGDFSINDAIEITDFEKIIKNLQPLEKKDVNKMS
ncbi:MAG: tRNA pseudouridine(55) synthase TruB [Salinivirgaceae bacterium]|nr:tRNA pseudouridine(55) synthase TruB [Salinivirgaceae bacterium]